MPRKGETERFTVGLASLAEITAFIALGLSIDLDLLRDGDVWLDGTVLFLLLTLVIRPLSTGPLLLLARLRPGERLFIMFGGLKGAVPILLAALAVIARRRTDEDYLYGLVYVVVLLSVASGHGDARHSRRGSAIPFRAVAHELARGPGTFTVARAAYADGRRVDALPLAERAWVGGILRDGGRVHVAGRLKLIARGHGRRLLRAGATSRRCAGSSRARELLPGVAAGAVSRGSGACGPRRRSASRDPTRDRRDGDDDDEDEHCDCHAHMVADRYYQRKSRFS